jgi:uncharacterized repeat protein (TIGR02543 family)
MANNNNMKSKLETIVVCTVILWIVSCSSNQGHGVTNSDTIPTYMLLISVSNGIVERIPDKQKYDSGEVVVLAPHPNSGYAFTKWTGDVSGDSITISVIMDNDKNVTAVFKPLSVPAGMKVINGGIFSMGQEGIATPVHTVTVSGFYMDSTEVTQEDYFALMGENPSSLKGEQHLPVESETWYDAVLYCNNRSKRDGLDTVYSYSSVTGTPGHWCSALGNLAIDFTKNGYRLPTEAEWEYACRSGTETKCFWGNDSSTGDNYAWSFFNSNNTTHPVAEKLPNPWGLYDMAGNVWEWCNDWFGIYSSDTQINPTGAGNGTYRVFRGGGWSDVAAYLRSASHSYYFPDDGYNAIGFRVVLPIR